MVNKLSVDIDDKRFETFKGVEIDTDLDAFGHSFNLTINIPIEDSEIDVQGKAIRISIDDEPLLTGFIEKQNITYSANSANITISGRDKVCDFVDSRVSNKTFATPTTIEETLKKLLTITGYEVVSPNRINGLQTELGANQIAIINEYGNIELFKNNEGIAFSKDESAYQLIQRLADKRRLVLGTNGDGNIVIRSIGQVLASTILYNDDNSQQNNIIDGNVVRDDSNRYYEYKILSSGSNIQPEVKSDELIIDTLPNNAVQYSGVFYDNEIRKTRKFVDNITNLTSDLCVKRAEWECNIRRARAFEYRCKVYGFRQNLNQLISVNPLWEVNQLVYVYDSQARINAELLIKAIKYKQDLSGGTVCEMVLVNPLAYTDSVFEIKAKAGKKTKSPALYMAELK